MVSLRITLILLIPMMFRQGCKIAIGCMLWRVAILTIFRQAPHPGTLAFISCAFPVAFHAETGLRPREGALCDADPPSLFQHRRSWDRLLLEEIPEEISRLLQRASLVGIIIWSEKISGLEFG